MVMGSSTMGRASAYDTEETSDLEIVCENIPARTKRKDCKGISVIRKRAKVEISSVNHIDASQDSYIKEEINISEASDSTDTDSSDDIQIEKCIIRRPRGAGNGRRTMNRKMQNRNGSLSSILLNCPKCNKMKTVYSTTIRSTCKECHEDMDFVCEKCNNKYDSMPALYRHKKLQCRFNVPGGLPLSESFIKKCTECSEVCKDWRKKGLDKCKSCKSSMNFSCTICSKWYTSYSGAYVHAKSECQVRSRTYYCNECNFKSNMHRAFLKHLKDAHLDSMPLAVSSPKFDLAFNNPKQLKQHEYRCASELFQCTFCVFKTESQEILREHTIQLHSNYPLEQTIEDIINEVTINEKSIDDENHQTFTLEDRESCQTQNVVPAGVENGSLDDVDMVDVSIAHCSSCKTVVPFSVGCSLRCVCGTLLDYACKLCDRLFDSRQPLYRHIRRKHGKTKRICTKCGRQFGLIGDATTHMKVCGQARARYSCTMCTFKTNYRNNLAKHINKLHKPPVHQACERCGAKYKCLRSLKRHVERCNVK